MAKSSLGISLLLLPLGSAAAQAPLTAEQAVETQERQVEAAVGINCRRDVQADEIVVCGRGSDPYRVPLPNERVPGERTRMLPGELPTGVDALSAGNSPCSTVGPNQRCGGGLDVFRVVGVLAKLYKHLREDEE